MVLRFACISWTLLWLASTQSTFLKIFRCSRFSEFDINYNWKFQRQAMIHGECGKRSDGVGGGRDFPAKWCLNIERRNSVVMTCHCPYPDLGSDSDGLKPMFNKSEALPKSLFCCKACTGLCASVAGFEATLNEFSRLKANLILVLKFQIVTWSYCSSALGRPGQWCFQNSQKKLSWKFSEWQTSIHSDWEPWNRCHQSP